LFYFGSRYLTKLVQQRLDFNQALVRYTQNSLKIED